VAVKGWVETLDRRATDFAAECVTLGVQTIIYTDIARDGMMSGPNVEQLEGILRAVTCEVIASGGVSRLEDLTALRELGENYPHLHGVITGKALYDGAFEIGAALAAVR
jgi:phosphoribosylformimino-5-aminoimidazole carboxamide ribotide isomerase